MGNTECGKHRVWKTQSIENMRSVENAECVQNAECGLDVDNRPGKQLAAL